MSGARQEMNAACQEATNFAFDQLEKHGNFIPFAVVVGADGGLEFVMLGEDQISDDGEQNLSRLKSLLQDGARRQEYRAVAIVSDVRFALAELGEVTDAVQIHIEHLNDEPILGFFPYQLTDGKIEQLVDPFMEPGVRTVFGSE